MAENTQRKTFFILALAFSLVVAGVAIAVAVINDEVLRERLGSIYYIIGFSIVGCVLLVLAGYVWDRTLMVRLKSLRTSVPETMEEEAEPERDEIIGLARNIERMARALQKTEASYRGIVEDQVDLICRYRVDGNLMFVNSAFEKAFGRRRNELTGQPFVFFRPEAANTGEPSSARSTCPTAGSAG